MNEVWAKYAIPPIPNIATEKKRHDRIVCAIIGAIIGVIVFMMLDGIVFMIIRPLHDLKLLDSGVSCAILSLIIGSLHGWDSVVNRIVCTIICMTLSGIIGLLVGGFVGGLSGKIKKFGDKMSKIGGIGGIVGILYGISLGSILGALFGIISNVLEQGYHWGISGVILSVMGNIAVGGIFGGLFGAPIGLILGMGIDLFRDKILRRFGSSEIIGRLGERITGFADRIRKIVGAILILGLLGVLSGTILSGLVFDEIFYRFFFWSLGGIIGVFFGIFGGSGKYSGVFVGILAGVIVGSSRTLAISISGLGGIDGEMDIVFGVILGVIAGIIAGAIICSRGLNAIFTTKEELDKEPSLLYQYGEKNIPELLKVGNVEVAILVMNKLGTKVDFLLLFTACCCATPLLTFCMKHGFDLSADVLYKPQIPRVIFLAPYNPISHEI